MRFCAKLLFIVFSMFLVLVESRANTFDAPLFTDEWSLDYSFQEVDSLFPSGPEVVAGIIGGDELIEENSAIEEYEIGYLSTREPEDGESPFMAGEFDMTEANAALASWYGPRFHGRRTCTGERFNQNNLTLAAHKWIGQIVCVSGHGKSVTAKVNDCGPYQKRNGKWVPHSKRSYDLSRALMRRIKGKAAGFANVTVKLGPCHEP